MRQKLDSTSVLVKDISDQPQDSRYILFLVGFLGERAGLAVDGVREKDAVMEAWVDVYPTTRVEDRYSSSHVQVVVAKWNPTMPWALVERSRLESFSVREWMKRLAQDSEDSKALVKEIFPNGGGDQMVVATGDAEELAAALNPAGGGIQGYL